MIITNPDPKIFVIKNFISESEAKILVDLAVNATQEEWFKYNYTERHKNDEWEDRMLMLEHCSEFLDKQNKIVSDTFNNIKKEIGKILKKDIYEYTGFKTIYRSATGQEMKTHSDSGLGPSFKYGVVLYLNGDYEGGEIFYPNIGLEFKPEAYSLVLHPAHEAYRHGVKEVSFGTRYSMTTFLKLK
jgi:sarcosine oxidase delta subunit